MCECEQNNAGDKLHYHIIDFVNKQYLNVY